MSTIVKIVKVSNLEFIASSLNRDEMLDKIISFNDEKEVNFRDMALQFCVQNGIDIYATETTMAVAKFSQGAWVVSIDCKSI